MITITESAKKKIDELIAENRLDDTYSLRVGVKGGGCSGLSYILDFDNEKQTNDESFTNNGVKVLCDKGSMLYLEGTELDYSGGLKGKGFEFKNPNAARNCSCGNSFCM